MNPKARLACGEFFRSVSELTQLKKPFLCGLQKYESTVHNNLINVQFLHLQSGQTAVTLLCTIGLCYTHEVLKETYGYKYTEG